MLFFVLIINQNNVLNNYDFQSLQSPKSSYEGSAPYSSSIVLSEIRFTNNRGSSQCNFELETHSYSSPDTLELCEKVIMAIDTDTTENHVRYINNGTIDTSSYFESNSLEPHYMNAAGENKTFIGTSEKYILPTTDFKYYGGLSAQDYPEIVYTPGTYDSIYDVGDFELNITWEFYPMVYIDSIDSLYDSTNTYLKIFDEFTDIWTTYQDYEDVVIYHPIYKIKIYDKNTDDLLFEDTVDQYFKYYRSITIGSIKLTNNDNEPVIFKLSGTNPKNQQINPFNSLVLFYNDYTSYIVEDLYGNLIDSGGSVNSGDFLIYTPPYEDNIFLKYIDQNELTLDFNDFRTKIDFGDGYVPILNQMFTAERNSTINISVYNLDLTLLTNDSLFVNPGLNYKNITIPVVYIENNADELITAYLFNESSTPTDFYTYSYLDSDYESYENSSYIENFDSNSFQDTNISFVNNSNNCPSLSVAYENQINIEENNTFNIYPIKTVNDISIVKIWNNITLINETLSESSGYYSKNFNSSYSHYYSVEIYVEDISGFYNTMKIDNIFVLKNQIRINLENLQNKYIQYTSLNISASLYKFDGSLISGSVNFTLKYPNGTIIKEDQTPNLEYNFGYTCDYYTLIAEYFGDLDNLACSIETIFEVITPPGQSYKLIYFDEDPIFNITISPYSEEFHNMTSFSDENLYIMYFDIYNNELHSEVFNFSTTNTLDYTPEMLKQCRIIFTDQFSNLLLFENYHVYINNESMLSNIFYRSVDSILNITVFDLFGNLLYENDYTVEREDNFIDLTLNQFSLKILNQLHDSTILNITNQINPFEFVLSEYIAIEELLSLYVKAGNYSIYYLDDSGTEHTLNVKIDESKLIILNTTYHEVHFAFFDLSGLGLDSSTARFYINGQRRDIGKNWVQGDNCSIEVLDYFNATLYSESISLVRLTEYNIYLPVYTMLINNNFTTSMELSIQRIGIGIEFRQIIPAQYGFDIRLLANVEYGIHMYYTNGTLAESKTVLLNENYKQISFGFYSEPVSITPEDIKIEMKDYLMLTIIAVISLTVIALILIKKSKDLENVPKTLRKTKKSNPNFRGKNSMDVFGI